MVFHEHGYERARISDITDSLGIGKGTLYLYFHSKKDLLLQCLGYPDELIGDLEEELELRGGDFFSNLRARMQRVDQYSWFSPLIDLTRVSEHSPDPEVRSKAKMSSRFGVTRMARDLVKAIQDGRIRDIDPELAVVAYVGMADNVRRRVLADDRYSLAEGEDFVMEAMTAWLSPNPSKAVPDTTAGGTVIPCVLSRMERGRIARVRLGGRYLGCWLGPVGAHRSRPPAVVAIHRSDDSFTGSVETREGDQFEFDWTEHGRLGRGALGNSQVELLNVAGLTFRVVRLSATGNRNPGRSGPRRTSRSGGRAPLRPTTSCSISTMSGPSHAATDGKLTRQRSLRGLPRTGC
jgi:AcrR family transcriptional regulator